MPTKPLNIWEALKVFKARPRPKPVACMHTLCPKCHGTGRDVMGQMCVHAMSCPCPKHRPGSL